MHKKTPVSVKSAASVRCPSAAEIAASINRQNNNGYQTLAEAFLAILPDALKEPEHDSRVIALFSEVKRCLTAPARRLIPTGDQAVYLL